MNCLRLTRLPFKFVLPRASCLFRTFSSSPALAATVKVADVKKGQIVDHKDSLWVVTDRQHVSQGRGGAIYKLILKDIKTNSKTTERFNPTNFIEIAELEKKTYQFLYIDGNKLHMLDEETFDEHVFGVDMLDAGEKVVPLLKANAPLEVIYHESSAILVSVPKTDVFTIENSPPPPSSTSNEGKGTLHKIAELEGGFLLQVPEFIKIGDQIVVDLLDQKYLRKA
ncbi:hypothetical protein HK096_005537 [Nowakowskiella sp. JEL0078]|nr:hypothetical protein HK096_005537 [Nowakowskiella sp. JEL0078]